MNNSCGVFPDSEQFKQRAGQSKNMNILNSHNFENSVQDKYI